MDIITAKLAEEFPHSAPRRWNKPLAPTDEGTPSPFIARYRKGGHRRTQRRGLCVTWTNVSNICGISRERKEEVSRPD